MRNRSLSFVALIVFAGTAVRADDADVKKEIQADWAAIVQSMLTGDAGAVTKAAAKDFQFMDISGRLGPAAQWADRAKSVLSAVTGPSITPVVQSVTIKGESAQAFLRARITGTGKDRLGEQGPLEMTVTYRTDWAKEGGAWKMKSTREVMFDGKTNKRPLNLTRSQAEEDVRKQFQALYGAVSELYEKQDWEAMEKGIPESMIIHDADGNPLSKKELIERVKAGARIVSNPIASMDAQQVTLDGDKVTLVRVMKLFGDVTLPGGKTGRLSYLQVARDTFQKAEKGYAPKSSDELYAEASVNGIPIPLSAVSGR